MEELKISKVQMLKEMGEYVAKRNSMKPKLARRALSHQLKKASYDEWLALYNEAKAGGMK